jgi:hypothetical protein
VARRSPKGGELAWALSRFEMGCERLAPFEALTDYLLALRALLEPEGPETGRLGQRLAVICARDEERTCELVGLSFGVLVGSVAVQDEMADFVGNRESLPRFRVLGVYGQNAAFDNTVAFDVFASDPQTLAEGDPFDVDRRLDNVVALEKAFRFASHIGGTLACRHRRSRRQGFPVGVFENDVVFFADRTAAHRR